MFLSGNSITSLFLGEVEINKAYLGEVLVWDKVIIVDPPPGDQSGYPNFIMNNLTAPATGNNIEFIL